MRAKLAMIHAGQRLTCGAGPMSAASRAAGAMARTTSETQIVMMRLSFIVIHHNTPVSECKSAVARKTLIFLNQSPHTREAADICYDAKMFQQAWFWIILGYLCGAIPFGLFIGFYKGVDIRTIGSKNIGSTNVGRMLGKKWGLACFLLDLFKGMLPVIVSGLAMGTIGNETNTPAQAWGWLGVAAATMVGHIFPIWLKFKGGKGVATGLGAVLGFWPTLTLPALAAFVVWFLLVLAFGYVSLASMIGAVAVPIFLAAQTFSKHQSWLIVLPFMLTSLLMAVLVLVRHRTNAVRLINGTEAKVWRKKTQTTDKPNT